MKNLNGLNGKSTKSQSGFTLIEIAIVLVIIGLLLGGVLQGQQLIENSRVKAAVNDFNGISAAAFSYQDRYGRLPGDDGAGNAGLANVAIRARGASWAAVTAGNESGVIDSVLATTFLVDVSPQETNDFFQHLRAAGFIAGDPAATGLQALPQNSFGGLIGVTTTDVGNATLPAVALTGTKICMGNVGGSAAIAIDTQLDDGSSNSGRVRAFAGGGNAAPTTTDVAAYSEDATYTVCYRI